MRLWRVLVTLAGILVVGLAIVLVVLLGMYANFRQEHLNLDQQAAIALQLTATRQAASETPTPRPATQTPIPTPTLVETLTPTPTATGRPTFNEDFEADMASGWRLDDNIVWHIVEDPSGNRVLQGGGTDYTQAMLQRDLNNHTLDFRVRVEDYQSGAPFSVYLRFRNHCENYEMTFQPDAVQLVLGDYPSFGDCQQIELLDMDALFDLREGEWMSVKLSVIRDRITCTVDDWLLIDLIHNDLHNTGEIGFSVQDGNIVWFDDIRITELEDTR